MADSIRSTSHEDYADSYGAYLKYSSQNVVQKRMIAKHLEFAANLSETVRVLSVGAGRGEFDMLILEMLRQGVKNDGFNIEYTVVEPNKHFLELFKKRVEENPSLGQVKFTWHRCTFEEFEESWDGKDNSYDLIFFIHSIYYFKSLLNSMSFATGKLLSRKGKLFTMTVTNEGHVLRVAAKYEELKGIKAKSIPVSGNDVVELGTSFPAFKFSVFKDVHPVTVTEIFNEDSRVGGHLLDFYTHTADFRTSVDKQTIQIILDFIKSLAKEENNDLVIYDGLELVIINTI